MFLKKTPEKIDYAYTYKRAKSPSSQNNSIEYTTMADSFSRTNKTTNRNMSSGKNLISYDNQRINSSRGFDRFDKYDKYEDSRRNINSGRRNLSASSSRYNEKKRSLSSSLNYNSNKQLPSKNKIISNLQGFVDTSPSIKTIIVRKPILLQKTNFTKRNVSESRNKLHIRDRYPYDEYKIGRDPKNNLDNGTFILYYYILI